MSALMLCQDGNDAGQGIVALLMIPLFIAGIIVLHRMGKI